MATTDEIRANIDRYIATFSSDDSAGWAAMFAEDGTQEDPVGAPLNKGRAAIQAFHENMKAMLGGNLQMVAKEEPIIIGHEVALTAYAIAGSGEGRVRMPRIIDHITFNDDGSIASLRAFWTMESMEPAPE